jgi:hypothetical protein
LLNYGYRSARKALFFAVFRKCGFWGGLFRAISRDVIRRKMQDFSRGNGIARCRTGLAGMRIQIYL